MFWSPLKQSKFKKGGSLFTLCQAGTGQDKILSRMACRREQSWQSDAKCVTTKLLVTSGEESAEGGDDDGSDLTLMPFPVNAVNAPKTL